MTDFRSHTGQTKFVCFYKLLCRQRHKDDNILPPPPQWQIQNLHRPEAYTFGTHNNLGSEG